MYLFTEMLLGSSWAPKQSESFPLLLFFCPLSSSENLLVFQLYNPTLTVTEERTGLIYLKTVNCKNKFMVGFSFTVTQALFNHVNHMGLRDTSVEELEKKYVIFSQWDDWCTFLFTHFFHVEISWRSLERLEFCCFCINNETLELGLAKWQVPEEVII